MRLEDQLDAIFLKEDAYYKKRGRFKDASEKVEALGAVGSLMLMPGFWKALYAEGMLNPLNTAEFIRNNI